MSKHISLTPAQWSRLKTRLMADYPISVLLIREKMKNVLGFVARDYEEWNLDHHDSWEKKKDVRLDFYNEPKRTMFLLKYSEYLDGLKKTDRKY